MNIFCDIDGTIIDSSQRHVIVLKDVLNNMHLALDDLKLNQYLKYKANGKSTKEFLEKIIGVESDIAEKAANQWIDTIENDEYLENDNLYPDSLRALETMHAIGDIFFATARNNVEGLFETLKRLNIIEFAKEIFVVQAKNAIYNKQLAISPHVSVGDILIGDTEVDLAVANILEIKYYLLNRGFRNKQYWDNLKIESYCDLLSVVMLFQ